MKSSRVLLGAVLAVCCATTAWGANSVVIESKTVLPGATDVTVGIYFTNEVSVGSMELPFEIRSVTPGAYITAFDYTWQGRLLPFSDLVGFKTRATPGAQTCSGPVSHTWLYNAPFDFVSPDGMRWLPYNSCMSPGTDGVPGSGTPSILMTLDVSCIPGTFEIDTCCFDPGFHLRYFGCSPPTVYGPEFTKGVITIDLASGPGVCNDRPADVNCDGVVDVFDVVIVVGVAYREDPEPDPCCDE